MSFDPNDTGDFSKKSIYEDFDPALLVEKGLELQAVAMALAAPHVKTGEFEGSFDGFLEHASNGHPYFRLYNEDPAALSIEFGTAKTAGQHILGRAGDAIGNDRVYVDTSGVAPIKAHTAEETKDHQKLIDEVHRRAKAARTRAKRAAKKSAEGS